MNNYSTFNIPQIAHGRGSLSFFSTLGKKRIAVVKGGRSFNDDVKKLVESEAEKSGATVCYVASIRNEPYIEDIFECMERVRAFEPDMILAIGGGSVLDTAKAIHLFYENPDLTFEQAMIPYSLPKLGKKAVHISVPTTSGTGSEATSVAVFIDNVSKTKKLLLDNNLIPHYAILDANLTTSLPNSTLQNTAMDALTHAIEASTAENGSVLSRAYALEAAIMLIENISEATKSETPEKKETAREALHIASFMAGVAISNSCTGIAHSYDHPGARFNLPHGAVCGLMLPYSMMMCGETEAYKTLSKRLGLSHGNVKELADFLIDLMNSMGMKTTFQQCGIDETEYFENVNRWSEISLSAFATLVSPSHMTLEKGKEFYRLCYYGK